MPGTCFKDVLTVVVAAVLKVVFRRFAPVQTAFPQGHVAALKGRDLMLRITLK